MGRLKLEDVGRIAGVSRATVSRVVNGEQHVRPEVRQRVEAVIAQTGYTPNAAGRSLASDRTGVIGLVIPSRVHSLFEDPYFGQLIQGVTLAGNRVGKTVSLVLFENEDEERVVYPRVVESGLLDGVIMTATRIGDPLLARLAESDVPAVVVGRPDVPNLGYVDVNNVDGGRQAAAHLIEIGCDRIGLISPPSNTTTGLDRAEGFAHGLAAAGRVLEPAHHQWGDFSEASGYRAMLQLLDEGVDGVFASSDTMALGALRAARERGVAVPDDVSIVGFDGFTASLNSVPPLTTISQPTARTAECAVRDLTAHIDDVDREPSITVLDVELVVRASTRPRKSAER